MYVIREPVQEEAAIEARLIVPTAVFTVIPCRMLDVSRQGATIRLGADYELPSHVFLLRDDNDVLLSCSTRWQEERMASLTFIDLGTRSERKRILGDLRNAVVLEEPAEPEPQPKAGEAAHPGSEIAPPPAVPPLQR